MMIQGWGRYPSVDAEEVAPTTQSAASACLQRLNGSAAICRGMGRSYGDSALAPRVIGTRHLDLLLDFDEVAGTLRCGAGVTLAQLLEIIVPRGWFLPVTPGTKFVTVGGAIASDVHGKNHHLEGCFGDHVTSLLLMLGNGEVLRCSRSSHPDLFHATCGGMGLTGIILEASMRLKPVRSAFIEQHTLKAPALQEAIDFLDANHGSTYAVAWIDCLATGAALGRSLVMLGEHAAEGGYPQPEPPRLSIPFDMSGKLLNRFSIKAFNTLYFHRVQRRGEQRTVHYDPFFYPLDRLLHWNRLYGKRGFVQYQFVLPKQAGTDGMRAILERISASRRGSFLAVLKLFGKQNVNLLSFPMEGYTLALDFKIEDGLFELLEQLDVMVLDYGGRIYLTKDARMSEQTFKESYPHWELFQEVRAHYGAQGKFSSCQSQRLGLT